MARTEFVPGGAEVGQALREAADAIGTGQQYVKEVEGGFEAPKAVVDYYAKITVTPKDDGSEPEQPGTEPPTEPEVEPPYPDNTLPGPGSAGGEHPDNTLPEPEPQPEEPGGPGLPGEPGEPDPNAPYPDNTLPGPGSAGGEHPDNTLPQPEVPTEPDPNAPYPDNTLPGPGSAGGEHPDNTLPTPEPQPEPEPEPEPGNPLEPPIGRPDESWSVAELKAWAAENGIELATGLRKDDILVVINQSLDSGTAQG